MMLKDAILVTDLKASAYTIPTDSPESDGTLEWDSTTIILVEIKGGNQSALGYTYGNECIAHFINKNLKEIVIGSDCMNIPIIHKAMASAVRNSGNCGLASMAISAVDNALWDLKAKILDLPLVSLLGAAQANLPIYGSGGFTSYSEKKLQQQLGGWAAQGFKQVKMKVGREIEKDVRRVKAAREAIGDTIALFVDANGAYEIKEALEKAKQFADLGVTWFEEPVPSWDLKGLHFIRDHAPAQMNIASGEYGYNLYEFEKMLEAEAVNILQADATRCGGITIFMKAGDLCKTYQVPFSSHCAPALHLHAGTAATSFLTAEYFHDHARIENMLFEGIPQPYESHLYANMDRPGMGLVFKHADAKQFLID